MADSKNTWADVQQREDAPQHPVENKAGMNIVQNPLKVSAALEAVTDLQRHSKTKVVTDAQDFAKTHGLAEHHELFGRAALVARAKDFTSIPELLPDELEALQYEKDHKWFGTKMMWYSIGLCAVGAATQGALNPISLASLLTFQAGIKLAPTVLTCHSPKSLESEVKAMMSGSSG